MSNKRENKDNYKWKKDADGKGEKGSPNNKKYKGNNSRSRSTPKSDSRYANTYVGEENSPEWYNKLNTLIKDVTSIPFGTQVGTPTEWKESDTDNLNFRDFVNQSVPGVMALKYATVPGIAKSASDGVNIAATGLFQQIRKGLSTTASYAPADVMMYVLAYDGLLTQYNVILRAFGVLPLYSSLNYNYNITLLRAMGMSDVDIADFKANYSNYRSEFNNLIYKASTIYMPTGFSILDRHAWLFSNFFIDADSPKSQIYLHVPAWPWILNETVSQEGTAVVPYTEQHLGVKWMKAQLLTFEDQIEAIRNSDSMNKIAADMARSITTPSWRLPYCDDKYVVTPTYSKEVLSQIENTTILPTPVLQNNSTLQSWYITQSVNKNIVLFNPDFRVDYINGSSGTHRFLMSGTGINSWRNNSLINMHWSNPSPDDVAVATRNMVVFDSTPHGSATGSNPYVYFHLDQCGSDVCVDCIIYGYDTQAGSVWTQKLERFNWMSNTPDDTEVQNNAIMADGLFNYIAFDWAPIIAIGYRSPASPDAYDIVYDMIFVCDYDNYTFISPELLNRMHRNVITSMWSIPQLGEVTL